MTVPSAPIPIRFGNRTKWVDRFVGVYVVPLVKASKGIPLLRHH